MRDFIFQMQTKVIFGADKTQVIGKEVKAFGGTKVMIVYGGGSVKRSGLLQLVEEKLTEEGIGYVELGGVKPNPLLDLVHEGVELGRRENVDFLIGLGGGSAIDTAKAIGLGLCYDGDVWDFFDKKAIPERTTPVACVLTLPATGTEVSKALVITNEEKQAKKGLPGVYYFLRPVFSILDPKLTYTLPPYQTSSGCVDIMMHTMERYFSKADDNELTDAFAFAVIKCIIRNCPIALKDPENYQARSEIMWAGSVSHCDLTGLGLPTDWATHQIEHELSTAYNVTHGAGLAAVWSSWARYTYKEGLSRFVKYAKEIWGIDTGDAEADALAGIDATDAFFRSINMPVCISELIGHTLEEDEIKVLAHRATFLGTRTIGNLIVMKEPEIEDVYRMANH